MKYETYILWSDKLQRFYVGSTKDVKKRLTKHNFGYVQYTSKGIPWKQFGLI